ncbi:pyrroline-5-carboxylate reductase dimerization domain-containing protein [Enterococcus cecorum]
MLAAICGNTHATKEQLDLVLDMFNAVGKAWFVAEKDFSNFTAIVGSSLLMLIYLLIPWPEQTVKHGLPKQLSTEIAAQAVLGSAKMILESEENPWGLIDKVCSPGGTTVVWFIGDGRKQLYD